MTNRSEVDPLTYCATLLDDTFGNDSVFEIICDFDVVSIINTSQHGGVTVYLKSMFSSIHATYYLYHLIHFSYPICDEIKTDFAHY